jgi:SAM-dependent methyltransferase
MHAADDHDGYGAVADLYDHVVPYRTREDVAFFAEAARDAGGDVLEIGCGTGRVLVPCARAGASITGLDRSPDMLAVCRQHLDEERPEVGARVSLTLGDMRAFDLGRTFALVTMPFRPFQHLLTVDDQLACLAAVRRHLDTEGRLIVDLFNPSLDGLANREPGEEFGDEPEFTTPDGRRVLRRMKITAHDRFAQILDTELIYNVTHLDGRNERLVHPFRMRYLFRFEMEHLLVRAGFEVEHLYAGYDKARFGSRYPGELVFVARRGSTARPGGALR